MSLGLGSIIIMEIQLMLFVTLTYMMISSINQRLIESDEKGMDYTTYAFLWHVVFWFSIWIIPIIGKVIENLNTIQVG